MVMSSQFLLSLDFSMVWMFSFLRKILHISVFAYMLVFS